MNSEGWQPESQSSHRWPRFQVLTEDIRATSRTPWQAAEGSRVGVVSSQLLLSNHVHTGSINGVPTACQQQGLALGNWEEPSPLHLFMCPTLIKYLLYARFPCYGSE